MKVRKDTAEGKLKTRILFPPSNALKSKGIEKNAACLMSSYDRKGMFIVFSVAQENVFVFI